MDVQVASICPIDRFMYKPRLIPQKSWLLPAVPKGDPPAVLTFTDGWEQVFRTRDENGIPIYDDRIVTARQLADDFVQQNLQMPCGRNGGQLGLWIVDDLGANTTMRVVSATNEYPVIFQLDQPHRMSMKVAHKIQLSGATGRWGAINGEWQATPVSDRQLSIPVDTEPFGAFNSGIGVIQAAFRIHLSLEEEAKIMIRKQDLFFDYWLKDAAKIFAKNPNLVVKIHHDAADWFGVKGQPWQVTYASAVQTNCPFCVSVVPLGALLCAKCGQVIDPVGFAAEQFRIKQARDAETQRLREQSKRQMVENNRRAGKETYERLNPQPTIEIEDEPELEPVGQTT
jgi:hypothetical protein